MKDELIELLIKYSKTDKYVNPHLVGAILDSLSDCYSYENDDLDKWYRSLWEM